MRVLLQRVSSASVSVSGGEIGRIGRGCLALLGVGQSDTKLQADKMIKKIKKLRIFPDAQGKTNLSLEDIDGELMVISQFTLYADCRKGNRPGFTEAGSPAQAEALYNYFVDKCKPLFKKTADGEFGADMQVSLTNDGPFTVMLEID